MYPFPASLRLHLRVWKSTQLPSTFDVGEKRSRRVTEEEENERERWRWKKERGSGCMWSRVESTSRVSLGVRPEHIGFSGESWSMLPGSWLTHGIGYKPTRPADWFILSATPAYACYRATTLSVCLSPVISFSLSFLSICLLSSSSPPLIPLSSTHRPFYSAYSVPISLVDNLSFLRRALSNSRLFRARLGSPRF